MRYGVFTDVHSNLEAMTAVAGGMRREGVEEHLCLGDLVGYHADPNEVLDLIRSLDCWKIVLGNHDAAVLGQPPLTAFNEPAAEAIRWTRPRLFARSLRFLEGLRLHEEIGDIELVHASPFQSEQWHYLTRIEEIERNFRYFEGKICFVGHVHKPFVAEQEPGGLVRLLSGFEWNLRPECRYLVSAGSVGQPRDGDARATWMLYDSAEKKLRVVREPYDHETTARKVREAGLPESLAERLRVGR